MQKAPNQKSRKKKNSTEMSAMGGFCKEFYINILGNENVRVSSIYFVLRKIFLRGEEGLDLKLISHI